jgi:hypothetical protein
VESKWKNYHIITFPGQSLSKTLEEAMDLSQDRLILELDYYGFFGQWARCERITYIQALESVHLSVRIFHSVSYRGGRVCTSSCLHVITR